MNLDWLRLCKIDPSHRPASLRHGPLRADQFYFVSQSPNSQNLPARRIPVLYLAVSAARYSFEKILKEDVDLRLASERRYRFAPLDLYEADQLSLPWNGTPGSTDGSGRYMAPAYFDRLLQKLEKALGDRPIKFILGLCT